jgi:SAM-dependent methyltransferase
MPTSATIEEIRSDFDHIASLSPIRPGSGFVDLWISKNLPASHERLLEIGCGVGELVRTIGPGFGTADAIDISDGMISEARRRTPPGNINFACADMFEWLQDRPDWYDCIVTVATLHHVDFEASLRAMSRALKAGGRLLIVDLYDRSGVRNLPVNAVAHLVNAVRECVALVRRRSSIRLRLAYRQHGRNETYLTLQEVRSVAARVLPGARVNDRLLWRYTLVWEK